MIRTFRQPLLSTALATGLAIAAIAACSSDDSTGSTGNGAGANSSAGTATQSGSSGMATAGGAQGTAGNGTGGAAAGSAGATVAGSGGVPPNPGFDAMLGTTALAANRSVGVEWNAVEGATSYKVYWAEAAAPSNASMSFEVMAPHATFVHRALTNGTVYQYAVSAIVGGQESALSPPAMATPTGEWVLEEFGSGIFDDITTGQSVPRVPVEKRAHLLLFAEGYTMADLPTFHADADHDGGRESDVDSWVDYVFSLEPYRDFREAFVVWQLPRASMTHFDGANTAFMVPVTASATGNISGTGETATRAWEAIALLPVQPTDFGAEGFASARTHVASFLLYDPQRMRAGVSGRMLGLRNPAETSQRIASAFGVGHAHEFTHAFSNLRDEYIELDNNAPGTSETSNVVETNVCGELPWSHLLAGGAHNATTQELVGAFGTAAQGYHSELICLMNGTHDNATVYGGDGLLRDDDRMCNFCREMTTYRIYSRTGILEDDETGFATWKSTFRPKFYERFPFQAPPTVPQTNNVRNPAQGMTVYTACVAAQQVAPTAKRVTQASPSSPGCIGEE
jgi:hypothetical protein